MHGNHAFDQSSLLEELLDYSVVKVYRVFLNISCYGSVAMVMAVVVGNCGTTGSHL